MLMSQPYYCSINSETAFSLHGAKYVNLAEKQLTRLNVGMLKVLLQVGMLMLVRYGKRSMKLELTEA